MNARERMFFAFGTLTRDALLATARAQWLTRMPAVDRVDRPSLLEELTPEELAVYIAGDPA